MGKVHIGIVGDTCCVMCGEYVSEGSMVCERCLNETPHNIRSKVDRSREKSYLYERISKFIRG